MFGRGKGHGPEESGDGIVIGLAPDDTAQKQARKEGKSAGKHEQPGHNYLPAYIKTVRGKLDSAIKEQADATRRACAVPMQHVERCIVDFNPQAVVRVSRDMAHVKDFIKRFDDNKKAAVSGCMTLEDNFLAVAGPIWDERGLAWSIQARQDTDEITILRADVLDLAQRWEAARREWARGEGDSGASGPRISSDSG